MFNYPPGQPSWRTRRLQQLRDAAFFKAAAATYRGLPNEEDLADAVFEAAGVTGTSTPLASNLLFRRRLRSATSRMISSLIASDEQVFLVGLNRESWAAYVNERALAVADILQEAVGRLKPYFENLFAVARLVAGDRFSPFIAPWEISADVIALCWGRRTTEFDVALFSRSWALMDIAVTDQSLGQVAASELWEVSGSDMQVYDWHVADLQGHCLDQRLSTPVARSFHLLSSNTLQGLCHWSNGGELLHRHLLR